MSSRFDAAVLGGGPAGCTCAITLARRGRRVLLADRQAKRSQPGDALAPAANRILRALGVWEQFFADHHLPCYGNLSAWGSDTLESIDFVHSPDGHGWHVDRVRFDGMLRAAAADAGVAVQNVTEPVRFIRTPSGAWSVRAGGHESDATWLVDCTGRSAAVARADGVRRLAFDRLTAFVSWWEGADTDCATVIEAVEHGWWYTARIPQGRRAVMYFTDAGSSMSAPPRHIAARLTGYSPCGPPLAVAANSSRLEIAGGSGWVAAGDAAASHDPLSSMGIANALVSGIRAAEAIEQAIGGDEQALPRYQALSDAAFTSYLRQCAAVYGVERRWPESPFWSRRAAPWREVRAESGLNPARSTVRPSRR